MSGSNTRLFYELRHTGKESLYFSTKRTSLNNNEAKLIWKSSTSSRATKLPFCLLMKPLSTSRTGLTALFGSVSWQIDLMIVDHPILPQRGTVTFMCRPPEGNEPKLELFVGNFARYLQVDKGCSLTGMLFFREMYR